MLKNITDTGFDLSIVIITWKMKNLLKSCLDSIYKYTKGVKFEIILIDNKSDDGTVEMIEKDFPEIRLVKNESNRGVAPARNQGLGLVKGKYILILDADIELIEDSISQLFDYMEKNSSCGLVGSKLVDPNGLCQYSCKRFPTFLSLVYRRFEHLDFVRNSRTLQFHIMKEWDHNSISDVDYLIGACQFFRKDVIDKIGFYDQNIFYGPEDIDFCLRIWKAGWSVVYYPLTSMIHREQRITKKKLISVLTIKHLLGILYIFKKYKGKIKK
jgi:N-acetylglucosaminyl-diphospho-decaprenol L-rhamnosyltransferase